MIDIKDPRGRKIDDTLIDKHKLIAPGTHQFGKSIRIIVKAAQGAGDPPGPPVFPTIEAVDPGSDQSPFWYASLLRPWREVKWFGCLAGLLVRLGFKLKPQEVLQGAKPLGRHTKVSAGAISELEQGWIVLKKSCQAGAAHSRTFADSLRFPDPNKNPGQYRLFGPPWKRRLTVLWGYSPRQSAEGAAIAPKDAIEKLRSPKRMRGRFAELLLRIFWLGLVPLFCLGLIVGTPYGIGRAIDYYRNLKWVYDQRWMADAIKRLEDLKKKAQDTADQGGAAGTKAASLREQADGLLASSKVEPLPSSDRSALLGRVAEARSDVEKGQNPLGALRTQAGAVDKEAGEIESGYTKTEWQDRAKTSSSWRETLSKVETLVSSIRQIDSQTMEGVSLTNEMHEGSKRILAEAERRLRGGGDDKRNEQLNKLARITPALIQTHAEAEVRLGKAEKATMSDMKDSYLITARPLLEKARASAKDLGDALKELKAQPAPAAPNSDAAKLQAEAEKEIARDQQLWDTYTKLGGH